ncbi:MAG: hypothetical protein EZS28_001160 [Streblomastix strix]|uniref:Uncharacterized protein n=1 Tax=Streblomastix strix TaxID=222440 RepID=A0A5J4X7V3_9EUKA|nr:MAG: hypothetical protein EZS28_001160 [Streblomastix strix]
MTQQENEDTELLVNYLAASTHSSGIRRSNKLMDLQDDSKLPKVFREYNPLIWISFYVSFVFAICIIGISLYTLLFQVLDSPSFAQLLIEMFNTRKVISFASLLTFSLIGFSIAL